MNSLTPNLNLEEELLLNLCRLSFNDEQKSRIKGLVKRISGWDHFIWLANEHGIVSIIFHNLEQLGLLSYIPESANSTLKGLYLKSLARNTFLVEKFVELKKCLDEIGIKLVVLKGMALEPGIYGNIGLRQMTDIDLYINDKNECLRAWKHLKNSGYISNPVKSSLHSKILIDYGKHMPDLNKDGISFDLHHSLFDNDHHIDTIIISTDAVELTVPAYDFHFLYLVKHLDYHELKGESQLRLYIDLFQIIKRTDVDINSSRIIDLAEKLGLKKILFEKLFLLHLIWSVPVKKDILNQLTDNQKSKAVNTFLGFLSDPKSGEGKNRGAAYRKTIKTIPTLRKKLIFLLGDIFPSVSFMQNRYNTKTRIGACLYYPVRLGKLLFLFIR